MNSTYRRRGGEYLAEIGGRVRLFGLRDRERLRRDSKRLSGDLLRLRVRFNALSRSGVSQRLFFGSGSDDKRCLFGKIFIS